MQLRIRILTLALLFLAFLSACNQQQPDANKKPAQTAQPTAPIAMPTDAKDITAWKTYFKDVVMRNMDGVQTRTPYIYFVPAGDDDDTKKQRDNQLDNVKPVIARGVLPGNMLAFGGPDSKASADLVIAALQNAQAGSMKGVRFLFIGKAEDSERVKAAVGPLGVEYRFIEMQ